MRSIGIAAATVCIASSAGCFQYRPAAAGALVPAGERVRVDLTDVGRVSVAPLAGEGIDQIDGLVESYGPDSLTLRVTALRRRTGSETWTRERLPVATRDVRSVSVKKFSAVRTATLVGAILVAGTTIRLGTSDSFFGGGRRSGTGTTGGR